MKRFLLFIFVVAIVVFTSCEKGELPVPKYDKGGMMTGEVALGNDYRYQVWYDLGSNKIIKTNLKTDWDIAFDCAGSTHWVYLNSSRLMMAASTTVADFDSVNSVAGLNFKADHADRNTDSLAFGDCINQNRIFVIDMGYDADGNQLGYKKIQFYGLAGNTYSFQFANLDGTQKHIAAVTKNSNYNTMAFSFSKNNSLLIEPPKGEYDLCFTQYTYFFNDPYMPYLVTGVLLNKTGVQVAKEFNKSYADISSTDVNIYSYSDSLDIIGYSWKEYDFTSSTYHIFPEKNFIIHDGEGFYYKLHFTDFYDSHGEKGNPKFEYQKL